MTSLTSAQRFQRLYQARLARIVPPKPKSERWADTAIIRELLLAQFGRVPRKAADAFEGVAADFGTVGVRRLWTALSWLLENGKIERIGTKHQGSEYRRRGR